MSGRALICGGGIAGLSTALALCRAGWEVTVLEQAAQMQPVGAGLQLSPNGVRVLEAAGVMSRLQPSLFAPESIDICLGGSGAAVARLPLGSAMRRRYGASYVCVHRSDLVAALLDSLHERAPSALVNGARLTSYENRAAEVVARCEDGREFAADILVAADGVNSAVRAQMLPRYRARYSGYTAWRALISADTLGDGVRIPSGAQVWIARDRHAVLTRVRGGDTLNLVGVAAAAQDEPSQAAGGAESGATRTTVGVHSSRHEAKQRFADLSDVVAECFGHAALVRRWSIYSLPPLPRWSDGRVVLVGDAAHPMMPSLAQGGVQALEDGYELAAILARGEAAAAADVLPLLYERRSQRVARVQRASMANLQMFHMRTPVSRLLPLSARLPAFVNPLSEAIAGAVFHRRTHWLYAHHRR